ncbi:odorant receptor 85c-like [Zootermopsis nevadensis]|nr:odorant receptor 85c-like [Zootermopsis nevadensis]
MCLCSFVAFISLYATLVCIACSQLEKLRASLLDIRQNRDISKDSGAETDQEEIQEVHISQKMFNHMQKQLNDCIRHHQDILEFMRALEATMNPMMLAHFLLIAGGMCFATFSAVTSSGRLLQLAQILIVYIAFATQLYTYCWFGTELTRQAESLSDAAWRSDWIGTPVSFQRCLIFIIATARRDFVLTAGKFVSVSRETMLTIINQTISYFMFLLNFKDMDTDADQ